MDLLRDRPGQAEVARRANDNRGAVHDTLLVPEHHARWISLARQRGYGPHLTAVSRVAGLHPALLAAGEEMNALGHTLELLLRSGIDLPTALAASPPFSRLAHAAALARDPDALDRQLPHPPEPTAAERAVFTTAKRVAGSSAGNPRSPARAPRSA